ncbi:hypothetical protein TVAG_139980 [Trichomonas vaginalis G3]|uniref:Uncharacterized protein n=1 Tax=Trichomonas vaginalis (strain ATCC PRA-98 / G3) TaxID=412133 RepID=A2F6E2_TRIV3|nr:hypothetical protein TVAGG3_0415090 [Trichomonas vaginalis G3]EAX99500.1 hypothetical protein TVAG_139980 [Trichomonas vaginalis G3]KAI5535634.1 hypothetical protein TVAGG3_0415090 [Trichomonas vaginalis G3]|eukprot:XP_001312430.1 hypothetical protein [Trichomonas vaginalis G3]
MIGNLISKLKSVIDSFPELTALTNEIDNIQKAENKRLAGLQQAFGSNLSEFAKSTGDEIKVPLLELQNSANMQVSLLRRLLTSTSSFPSDIKQISSFHDNIEKHRAALQASQTKLQQKEKEVQKMSEMLDREQKKQLTLFERSNTQAKLDECSLKMQEYIDENQRLLVEVHQLEYEYRKTIMQIVITAYETFSTANYRAYSEFPNTSSKIEAFAKQITAQTDISCEDLQKQLNIYDHELDLIKNEEDPKPR